MSESAEYYMSLFSTDENPVLEMVDESDGGLFYELENNCAAFAKAKQDNRSRENVNQSIFVVEECSELVKELCKEGRGRNAEKEIVEEMADVMIVCLTWLMLHDISVDEMLEKALEKVRQRSVENIF